MCLLEQPRQEISVELPDGSLRKGTSWETSPMDIAKQISQGLADRAVIAKVSQLSSQTCHGALRTVEDSVCGIYIRSYG